MKISKPYVPIYGNRVKELRIKNNWSLNHLASETRMTKQAISRIENGEIGKTQCIEENRKNLAIKLGCTVQYLAGTTNEVRGTGEKIQRDDGDEIELTSPMYSNSFCKNLENKVDILYPENGEVINLFMETISKMKLEEKQILCIFLKSLPAFSKYQSLKKSTLVDSIIEKMYEKNFTTEVYEIINNTISESKVREIRRRRLSKVDFQKQLKNEFGEVILKKISTQMDDILDDAFSVFYSPKRVKKDFISAYLR